MFCSQSTPESWAQHSHDNITRAEHERMASIQLRTLIDNVLIDTSRDITEQADAVNIAFARRTEQMDDTLSKIKDNLRRVGTVMTNKICRGGGFAGGGVVFHNLFLHSIPSF